jgi:hypothetical protein
MEKETLKKIFEFLEEKEEHNMPLKLKLIFNKPLPKGLKVGGNLDLAGSEIKSLPEGLDVRGNLYLQYSKITSLPEGLKVGFWLDIRNTKINYLPKGLEVRRSLFIKNTALLEYTDEELREMIKPGFIKGIIKR